ncbi:MAG: hypothetical protein A3F12_06155 [Gammaproteobacteria bacterium RIFCSPHIGHO2_12_FULL_38_14]|nr:MAG: hypothetical protein A3F12_06155 [Gammaproteobacteria bacterium RIFCSPHIGHO2_12_FULL_38_14]
MGYSTIKKSICYFIFIVVTCYSILLSAQWNSNNTSTLNIELNKGMLLRVGKNTGTIFIADPSIADFHLRAPGLLYLYTKRLGTTSLYVTNKQGEILFRYTIRVIQGISSLQSILNEVIPGNRIKIISTGENIILRGTVKSGAQAEDARSIAEKFTNDPKKVLTFLHVTAPTQVNLRVQVMEMSREAIRALGIDWTAGFTTNNTNFTINPILFPSEFPTDGSIFNTVKFAGKLTNRGNFNLENFVVNILERNGLVTVLSEPNLTALTGQTASFLVGGEFPIPVPQGNDAITIMFKKFGVSLAFTPTILENGKINLQVRPEVSQLSTEGAVTTNGFVIPSLSVRRAQTTVELNSGQSFAIAGLLQNNANKIVQQLPGISQVPVLGKLFRSERFKRNETELVIIVTPYIVQPVGNDAFLYPTDNANADLTLSYSYPTHQKNIGFILD